MQMSCWEWSNSSRGLARRGPATRYFSWIRTTTSLLFDFVVPVSSVQYPRSGPRSRGDPWPLIPKLLCSYSYLDWANPKLRRSKSQTFFESRILQASVGIFLHFWKRLPVDVRGTLGIARISVSLFARISFNDYKSVAVKTDDSFAKFHFPW